MSRSGKINRRRFLACTAGMTGMAAGGISSLLSTSALAQASSSNPIDEILQTRGRDQMNDQFDARRNSASVSAPTVPVFSPQTPGFIQDAINHYQQVVANGGWPIVPVVNKLQLGMSDPAVIALRQRLKLSGDLPEGAGDSPVFDSWVDAAVKRFQARHGLPSDGVMGRYTYSAMNVSPSVRLGQLETNLVRLRSMSGFLGDRYVMVNIPAAQIEAVEGDHVAARYTAVVGKIDRQSPILNSKIYEVILNPYWTAPKSIIQKDIIPLMRKDPQYLAKNHIRIINEATGQEIPAEQIDWNTDDAAKYMLRQDPGKINAMASTKINFHNPHSVYMHDTPQQGLFGQIERFNSSGCVRVQNVRDLVTWLLRDTPGWNRTHIEEVIASGTNTPIELSQQVPVYFTYITAWSTDGGVVHFRDDIYHRDGVAELALQ